MKKQIIILSVIILIVIILVSISILYFRKNNPPVNNQISIPRVEDTDISQIKNEIFEKYNDFPLYNSTVVKREYQKVNNGYEITMTLKDPIESLIFWYTEELDELGWELTEQPDITNQQLQSLKAIKQEMILEVKAERIDELTNVSIKFSKGELE